MEAAERLSDDLEIKRAVQNLLYYGVDEPTPEQVWNERMKIRRANSQHWQDPRMIRFGAYRG